MYGEYNAKACEESERQAKESMWFKPTSDPKGELIFLCPPAKVGQFSPWHSVKLHWGVLGKAPVVCLRGINPQAKCPVCERNYDLYSRKDDPKAQEISKRIYARTNYLYNVLAPLDTKSNVARYAGDATVAPVVRPYPATEAFHKSLLNVFAFNSNPFNPKAAMILHLSKVQTGDATRLQVIPTGQVLPLDTPLMELMNNLPDLTTILPVREYDELRALTDAAIAQYNANAPAPGATIPGNTMPNAPSLASTHAPAVNVATLPAPAGPVIIGGSTPSATPVTPVVASQGFDALEAALRAKAQK